MKIKFTLTLFFLISLSLISAQSAFADDKAGIDERLGAKIPLDLKFVNSAGDSVILSKIINKSTLLYFVYFDCAGICNPLQNAVAEAVGKMTLKAGEDYQIVTICFDHTATIEDARKWKDNSIAVMNKPIAPENWNVLTGDSTTIRKITDAVGFYFKSDGQGDFIHAGSVFTISPDGMISRYLNFDKFYNPFDLKMALLDASQNVSNPTIKTVLQFCFSYDPKGKQYVFNTTRVIGAFMIITVGGLFLFLLISDRKKKILTNKAKVTNE
jgi:protein SCO1/2